MRIHGLWVLLLTGLTSLVESTHAQPRSELYMCAPTCREAMPQVYTAYCDLILDFEAGEGRTLWGPLLNTGPVKVGIQATPFGEPVETLPLIVQVRVGEGETTCPPFEDGRFVFQTSGKRLLPLVSPCGPGRRFSDLRIWAYPQEPNTGYNSFRSFILDQFPRILKGRRAVRSVPA